MKQILLIIISIFFVGGAFSQPYTDSLITDNEVYLAQPISVSSFDSILKHDSKNIAQYAHLYNINESENIEKYKDKVKRINYDLYLSTFDLGDIIITSDSLEGTSSKTYYFIDYNREIDFYILKEQGWEFQKTILVNSKNGNRYEIPANLRILINEKTLVATFIDYVNGGSWLESYILQDNTLKLKYKFIDYYDKWLFYDAMINSDNELVVKCQQNYSEEKFKYYKIVKK